MANRHLQRTLAMQVLFEWDFNHVKEDWQNILDKSAAEVASSEKDVEFAKELVSGVVKHLPEIDSVITQIAPEWPIAQIAGVDRAVLRLSIFELKFSKATPPKVVINEAVEIGKRFGGESTSRFVNGVLGTLFNLIYPNETLDMTEVMSAETEDEKDSETLVE